MTNTTISKDVRPVSPLVILTSVVFFALAPGCAPEEEEVGVVRQAALNPNALNPNALNPNALNPSALSPSALSPSALDPDAMDPAALRAAQDPGAAGDLSRELLRYAVGCAFLAEQSFSFSFTDTSGAVQVESYPGLLGLAPSWATGALDLAGQQWVTDCLASRVNAEGVSVMLSSRGTNPALATTPEELETYQTREGAFFGNLFASTPRVYACYDPLSMLASRLMKRVCAQPALPDVTVGDASTAYDCGPIVVLGPCTGLLGPFAGELCASENLPERYVYDCAPSDGSPVIPSITTFLQGSIPS